MYTRNLSIFIRHTSYPLILRHTLTILSHSCFSPCSLPRSSPFSTLVIPNYSQIKLFYSTFLILTFIHLYIHLYYLTYLLITKKPTHVLHRFSHLIIPDSCSIAPLLLPFKTFSPPLLKTGFGF